MAYFYAYLFWNLEKGECELIFIKRGNEFTKAEKLRSSYVEYSPCAERVSLRAVCLDLSAWGVQGPHSRTWRGRGRGRAVLGSCRRLLEETRWTLAVVSLRPLYTMPLRTTLRGSQPPDPGNPRPLEQWMSHRHWLFKPIISHSVGRCLSRLLRAQFASNH